MKLTALSAVFLAGIAIALLPACSSAHEGDGNDITAVNGSVKTSPGQTYGTLTTVNGDVRVARGTGADEARTVNGDVELDDDARVGTARTVNGSVRVGTGAAIAREAQTVNGDVSLAARARVGGDVTTVSGEIELAGAEVTGKLVTRHGDIDLTDGARVRGGIHVQKRDDSNWGWSKSDPVKVHVCGTCVVDGELRFDQPVELRVDDGGKIGAVIGEKVTRL
jgi:DUF4097 and DUF4098 domain-containing protein YvlB